MKLFADWVVWNGQEFLSAAITKVIPFIDGGVIVDTGSTDATLNIAKAIADKYPKIKVIEFGSLAPEYYICNARNVAWLAAPPDTTWSWNIADDEVYSYQDCERLRKFLEDHEQSPQRFVKLNFRDLGYDKEDRSKIVHGDLSYRAMIHRWDSNARWVGRWGREGLKYPDGKHHMNSDKETDWLDPNVSYLHMNWLREKQTKVVQLYNEMKY